MNAPLPSHRFCVCVCVCVCVCFQGIPTIKVLVPLWPAALTQPGVIRARLGVHL